MVPIPYDSAREVEADRALLRHMSTIASPSKESPGTQRWLATFIPSSISAAAPTTYGQLLKPSSPADSPPERASRRLWFKAARPYQRLPRIFNRHRRRLHAGHTYLTECLFTHLGIRHPFAPPSSLPSTTVAPQASSSLFDFNLLKKEAAILGCRRPALFSLDDPLVRDASSPQVSPQEMESSAPGSHAGVAVHMPPPNPFDNDPYATREPMNFDAATKLASSPATAAVDDNNTTGRDSAYMISPAQQVFHDHLRPSNLRGAGEGNSNGYDDSHSMPASIALPNQNASSLDVGGNAIGPSERVDMVDRFMNDALGDPDPVSAVSEMSLNPEEMKGYAQLIFPDGEYLVTSTEIMLGRDERAQQILKDQERRLRRERREQALRHARQQVAEHDAQEALEQYKLEPSHASQQGEDEVLGPSSSSSQLLEGRPAPGLPSTFSEQGGIVNYEGSIDEVRRKKNKRRSKLLSHSSSTNSIAPASLHVYGSITHSYNGEDGSKCIFLPIHPFQPEDIRKISKEHLRIFYHSTEKHWKMEIKGNGAFVLNDLYQEKFVDPDNGQEEINPRHFKRDDTVILTHNTEVLVTSLTFLFKLPQRKGMSTFDSDDDEVEREANTSPIRQQSSGDDSASDAREEDSQIKMEDMNEDNVEQTNRKPKIKIRPGKGKVIPDSSSPEEPRRQHGGKGKKPAAVAGPSEQRRPSIQYDATNQAGPSSAPAVPPVFDANSTLQHVPVDELPEKRKGPGRPPKNGLVSKRDEGIIRRKMKEYEKRGERAPAYKDILAIVRSENRAKELAAKAAARGEPVPPMQIEMTGALPTTEMDLMSDTPNGPQLAAPVTESIEQARALSQEQDLQDSLKRSEQRNYKSPSPMKPREEYSEDQLKRPTQTYYYILDEILTEGPEDAMELQQIYDKICKKYPFYKYIVESNGWQSSVRHNLKQNDRFKPVKKQGKGWLWAIDQDVPLDKEKKKKPTPPPMARPPMQYPGQNGAVQHQQPGIPYNGAPAYATPYGQPPVNGQPAYQAPAVPPQQDANHQSYSSPYGQPGVQNPYAPAAGQSISQQPQPGPNLSVSQSQTPVPPAAPSSQQPVPPGQPSHPPPRPASNTPQPSTSGQQASLPPAFQDLVEEIMRFRVKYLSPFGRDPSSYARHERIFKRCVEWISQLHMRQSPEVSFENDEERRVFQILEAMRHKFEKGDVPTVTSRAGSEQSNPTAQATTSQTTAPSTLNVPGQSEAIRSQGSLPAPTSATGGNRSGALHIGGALPTLPYPPVQQDTSVPVLSPPVHAGDPQQAHDATGIAGAVLPAHAYSSPQAAVSSTPEAPQSAGLKRAASVEASEQHDDKRMKT